MIAAARETNRSLPEYVADRVLDELRVIGRAPGQTKVLVSGFAFKGQPPTEDVRGSAAIPVMRRLQAVGVHVWGHDFVTPEKVIADLGARSCSMAEGFEGADGVIIMNNHRSYLDADIVGLARRMRRPGVLFDSWGLCSGLTVDRVPELHYGSIGVPFRKP